MREQRKVVLTATEIECPKCGQKLWVAQHRKRQIEMLDATIKLVRRDKRCVQCVTDERFRPLEDVRYALPQRQFGLDVALHIGHQHVDQCRSLRAIGRELNERGVPIEQTTVGDQLLDFFALTRAALGDGEALRRRLAA